MTKEEKPFLVKAVIIVACIFIANIFVFLYKYSNSFEKGLTGLSIKDVASNVYTGLSLGSKIFLIIGWTFLFFILIFILIRDRGLVSKEVSKIDLKKVSAGSKTDLDTLYKILQDKKQLSIITISKLFNINEEIAMNWCQTLEEANLAVVDYPGMGKPIIRLIENA